MLSIIAEMKIWILLLIFSCIFLASCASELDQQMDACEEAFPSYAEEMSEIQAEWKDTLEIAVSTSRIALAGPVGELQDSRRQANKVTPPDCMTDSHERYLRGMDTFIDFFLDFMADADVEPNELEISIAQIQLLSIAAAIEQYEDDPEAFFEELRGIAATATAESVDQ